MHLFTLQKTVPQTFAAGQCDVGGEEQETVRDGKG